jgi:uncharacterized protein YecT (DUF1311 family)
MIVVVVISILIAFAAVQDRGRDGRGETAPTQAGALQEQTLVPRGREKPSFNCAQAKTAAARLICADGELARLDGVLGVAFQKRKAQIAAPDQSKFVAEHLAWIRDRNSLCELVGKDGAAIEMLASIKPCMVAEIRNHIAALGFSPTPAQPRFNDVENHVGDLAALAARNRADDPESITVDMSVTATPTNPPVIMGTTNLPEGTVLGIVLRGDLPACVPRCGFQGFTTVQNGRFTIGSELFGDEALLADSYTVEVVTVGAFKQSQNVQSVIGKSGEHLYGSYVVTLDAGAKYVPVRLPRKASPAAGENPFGLMIRYTQKIYVAGSASSDAAARTQAVSERRQSYVKDCTSNIDFVNGLVRSGAVSGAETLGAERQAKIDACMAESESNLQAALKLKEPAEAATRPAQATTPVLEKTKSPNWIVVPYADDSGMRFAYNSNSIVVTNDDQGKVDGADIIVKIVAGDRVLVGKTAILSFDCSGHYRINNSVALPNRSAAASQENFVGNIACAAAQCEMWRRRGESVCH